MQKHFRFGALILAVAVAFAVAASGQVQTQSAPSPSADTGPRPGASARVSLETQIDSRKLKVGDPVKGKLEQDLKEEGETVVPKNAHLSGHVIEATSTSQGAPLTRLAILFDHAVVKEGHEEPVYGVLFDVLEESADNSGIERIQQFHLNRMEDAANRGEPIDPNSEIGRTLQELRANVNSGQPTPASQQYHCTAGTLAGEIWCAPAGHTVLARPTGIGGLDGVYLQKESTPQGPIGVLMSGRKNIVLNRGTDLVIYFMRPR